MVGTHPLEKGTTIELIKVEWAHPLVSVEKNTYGGAFNLTFERGGHKYGVHVRKIQGEETIWYDHRDDVDMYNEPMPKTLRKAVQEWCDNDFQAALEENKNEAKETLAKHRELGIEKLRAKVEEYLGKIADCQHELEKAYTGHGFNEYVDTRE